MLLVLMSGFNKFQLNILRQGGKSILHQPGSFEGININKQKLGSKQGDNYFNIVIRDAKTGKIEAKVENSFL